MKKIIICTFILMVINVAFFAEIKGSRFVMAESNSDFDVMYYVTPDMKEINPAENEDLIITQSFEIEKNSITGELRYSLFKDNKPSSEELKIQFILFVYMTASNIAGFEFPYKNFSEFNDSDVKMEFNGDFGCTAFIQNPSSSFAGGYKFIYLEYFYRENQGIVIRTYLFNDLDFLGIDETGNIAGNSPLFSNYNVFKFMDKDEFGNYIKE